MIQLQFLNKVLSTQDVTLLTENNLTQDFFSDYSKEFNFIKEHIDKYDKIPDSVTFGNAFPDFTFIEVSESPKYLLNALYEDRKKRKLAKTFNEVKRLVTEGKVDEALKLFTTSANDITQDQNLTCVDLLRDLSRYDKYVERIDNFNKYYVGTGFVELDERIGGWDRQEELATIVARPGVGKCLAKGTKVLMADGSTKNVEDVQVGDSVQSYNRVNTVLGLHHGTSIGYKITPTDGGESFTVSDNHVLTLRRHYSKQVNNKIEYHNELVDITIEDYLKLSPYKQRQYKLFRPEVTYNSSCNLKIPPYVLGSWLGDDSACRHESSSVDREYNLFNNRHIPMDYITSNKEDRLQLLAGIIDTDGEVHTSRNHIIGYSLIQKQRNIIEAVAQIARSLGLKVSSIREKYTKLNNKKCGLYYQIHISGPIGIIPCRLSRKKSDVLITRYDPRVSAFKVEQVPYIEYYGFMCDGDSRYLLADNTLTHNTWVLLKCAASAAQQGLNVGIYSGEMSENKVGTRIDSLIGHIPNSKIMRGDASIQLQYQDYIKKLPTMFKGSLKVITPNMLGGPAGVTALRGFIERENLDILFIDQHSLLEDDRRGRTAIEKASNISKDLKNLQVLKHIPIIAVSQQNRAEAVEGNLTANVSQSDRIAQDSTIILFLEQKDDVLTITIGKCRDNASGIKLKYSIDLNRGIFEFLPDGADPLNSAQCNSLKNEFDGGDEF